MSGEWTENLRTLGKGAARDIQQVLEFAEQTGGWSGRTLRNGHIMLRHCGGGSTVLSRTPSDSRALKNATAQIRRAAR